MGLYPKTVAYVFGTPFWRGVRHNGVSALIICNHNKLPAFSQNSYVKMAYQSRKAATPLFVS